MDIIFQNLISKIKMAVFIKMFFTKLWETFLACSGWLSSKEFGLMIYNFGPASASGSSLSRPIPQRENKTQKNKITLCSFSLPRLETEYLAQRTHFMSKMEKAHTKLTNIV